MCLDGRLVQIEMLGIAQHLDLQILSAVWTVGDRLEKTR